MTGTCTGVLWDLEGCKSRRMPVMVLTLLLHRGLMRQAKQLSCPEVLPGPTGQQGP